MRISWPSLCGWLLLALTDAARGGAQPLPPRQSSVQLAVMERVRKSAKTASAAARPQLLALFASPEFKVELRNCCAELLSQSPEQLLQIYSEQLSVTEVAHGFNAISAKAYNNLADVNLSMAASAPWFYNMWQLPLLFPGYIGLWELVGGSCSLGPAAAAEVGIMQFPDFTGSAPLPLASFPGGWPASVTEAGDRVVYTEINQNRAALPCSPWGDVNVVFSPSLVADAVLLSPFDTGNYEVGCNMTYLKGVCSACNSEDCCQHIMMCHWNTSATTKCQSSDSSPAGGRGINCSGWDRSGRTLGTISDHYHVLLDYLLYSSDGLSNSPAQRLGQLMHGMFDPIQNRTDGGFSNSYFEGELAGTAVFPHGIHFVLASFSSLFGTAGGFVLQQWCRHWKWPLIWTSGGGWGRMSSGAGPQAIFGPGRLTICVSW